MSFTQPHFSFTYNTGNNATVGISSSINPMIGNYSIAIGDEIGAFTPGGLCVGSVVWSGQNTAITIWGNDQQTPGKDGIDAGETIQYRLWRNSDQREFTKAGISYSQGDGKYTPNGIYVLASMNVQGSVFVLPLTTSSTLELGKSKAIGGITFDSVLYSPILTSIMITFSGTATISDISSVRLFRDSNHNGAFDSLDASISNTIAFDQTIQFNNLGYLASAGPLIIVIDISATANPAHTIGISIASNGILGEPGTSVLFNGYTNNVIQLPVVISRFSGKVVNSSIHLEWETQSESDLYGFEVQRCISNSNTFDEYLNVGFVQARGYSNIKQKYDFTESINSSIGSIIYRLKLIDRDGSFELSSAIKIELLLVPNSFELLQNYPNPFNPSTMIKYALPSSVHVKLTIHDALGRSVTTLMDEEQSVGWKEVKWDASGFASGVYFYKMQAGSFTGVKKLILTK